MRVSTYAVHEHADMMAAEVIRDFRRHGGNGIVDGQALNLTATQPPPVDLLNELRTHKAELLTYLNAEARL